MHWEGLERRRSHEQNEVGGIPLPCVLPNISGALAQLEPSYQHPMGAAHRNAAGMLSLRPEVQESHNAV